MSEPLNLSKPTSDGTGRPTTPNEPVSSPYSHTADQAYAYPSYPGAQSAPTNQGQFAPAYPGPQFAGQNNPGNGTNPQNFGYGGYSAPRPTDSMAIASLVLGLVGIFVIPVLSSIPGVITGHIAMGRVKRNESDSRGLALAGLITSYAGLAIWLLVIGAFVVLTLVASNAIINDPTILKSVMPSVTSAPTSSS